MARAPGAAGAALGAPRGKETAGAAARGVQPSTFNVHSVGWICDGYMMDLMEILGVWVDGYMMDLMEI